MANHRPIRLHYSVSKQQVIVITETVEAILVLCESHCGGLSDKAGVSVRVFPKPCCHTAFLRPGFQHPDPRPLFQRKEPSNLLMVDITTIIRGASFAHITARFKALLKRGKKKKEEMTLTFCYI